MVICIQGGLVQAIYAERADRHVAVIDWDVTPGDFDDEFLGVVKVAHHGRSIHAYVDQPESLPLSQIEGTDLAAILEAVESNDAA